MTKITSLDDLSAIKSNNILSLSGTRIVVGMATCGIAAGAGPVFDAVNAAVTELNLTDKVTVTQTGCVGICQYEPVFEVYEPDKERVTYIQMTPEKAKRIIEEHIGGGKVVTEFTVGNTENTD
ncbi:MAG: (2Fe-2S) ferredoxin domain-containing protein, partial [Oscillospiraceae bacterium]|nr:(2Fe-2S) ferredoxin domain-containing protein [Oscillospiraceae bacterium]